MMLLLTIAPLQMAYANTGDILREMTPLSDNGRALAFDGTYLIATYTGTSESTLYFWTTSGASAGTVGVHDATGASVSCGSLSWDGAELWCGTYDGTGRIFTVNEATGLATLQFTSPSMSDPSSEECYGGSGYIDGIAYDGYGKPPSLFLGEDAATKVWQTSDTGAVISSFTAPYATVNSVTYSCKSGIALEPGTYLWMAIYSETPTITSCLETDPDCSYNTGLIAQFTEGGVYTGVSFPSIGNGGVPGQLKEGLAWDSTTFAPNCAIWALTNGLPTQGVIDAYQVTCPSTSHGVPEFGTGPLLVAAMGAILALSLRQAKFRRPVV
jgi:hypothetical protein